MSILPRGESDREWENEGAAFSRDAADDRPTNASEQAAHSAASSEPRRPGHATWSERKHDATARLLVALVDSRSLIRDALAHRLSDAKRNCAVLPASSASELLRNRPIYEKVDVILVSACCGSTSIDETLDTLRELVAASDRKPIIVFSDRDDERLMKASIRLGARGYIPTNFDLPVAMAAMEVVLAGGTFAPATCLIRETDADDRSTPAAASQDPTFDEKLAQEPCRADADDCLGLTTREADVLARLPQGKSNKMIAREVGICEGTVKVHLRNLMRKLHAANRTQLAVRAQHVQVRGSQESHHGPHETNDPALAWRENSGFAVLIVDDDSAVRAVVEEILRVSGLSVFSAKDAHEALRVLRNEPINLLLADIVMPGMDGVQLAARAKVIRPDIKVLFATGYAQKATERHAVRLGRVLFKPIRRPELIREVESLLCAPA